MSRMAHGNKETETETKLNMGDKYLLSQLKALHDGKTKSDNI
jgi:hypothetical protein